MGVRYLALLQLGGVSKHQTPLCGYTPLSSTGQPLVPGCGSVACLGRAQVQSVLGPQLRHHLQVASRQFYGIAGRLRAPIPSREPRTLLWSRLDRDRTVARRPSVSPSP